MIRIKNAGAKIAGAMIAMGLTAGAAFAEVNFTMNVTLPQAVNVGGKTLPNGTYHVDELRSPSGERMLVFYNSDMKPVAVVSGARTAAMKNVTAYSGGGFNRNSEVILSTGENGVMHVRSMFQQGDQNGFGFRNHR